MLKTKLTIRLFINVFIHKIPEKKVLKTLAIRYSFKLENYKYRKFAKYEFYKLLFDNNMLLLRFFISYFYLLFNNFRF